MNYFSPTPLRAALAAALVLAALPAASAEVNSADAGSFDAAELSGLTVSSGVGMVEVRGESREDVVVKIQYSVGAKKQATAESVIDRFSLGMTLDGDWLVVMPLFDGEDFGGRKPPGLGKVDLRVDLLVLMPRDLPIIASVTSADLDVMDLVGGASLSSTSGDIGAHRLEGDVVTSQTSGDLKIVGLDGSLKANSTSGDTELATISADVTIVGVSGDIDIQDADGTLEINNKGGDVLLQRIDGPVTVTSNFGRVEVIDARGLLQVNSSSGEISAIGVGFPGQSLSLVSSSGDIDVRVLPDAALRIAVSTADGAIRARLPMEIEDISRTRLLGTMNNGNDMLEIVTASGDIRIFIMEE